MKLKPITAWAVVKEKIIKDKYGKFKKEYKLSGYDIFVDNDIELGNDEKIIKVLITPYASNTKKHYENNKTLTKKTNTKKTKAK